MTEFPRTEFYTVIDRQHPVTFDSIYSACLTAQTVENIDDRYFSLGIRGQGPIYVSSPDACRIYLHCYVNDRLQHMLGTTRKFIEWVIDPQSLYQTSIHNKLHLYHVGIFFNRSGWYDVSFYFGEQDSITIIRRDPFGKTKHSASKKINWQQDGF